MSDPNHLLSDVEDRGITVALIPTSHPGVQIGHRHFPMGMTFMNGPTRGENVFIPLEWIIGGVERAGQGWRMLVECLSEGRAISLPALGTATGKLSYRLTGAYARIRTQFNLAIGNFEGVEEALARIAGLTYQLEAARIVTAGAVDKHIKPAVVSAIAKYHMTEKARLVIQDAMDIHGGRGLSIYNILIVQEVIYNSLRPEYRALFRAIDLQEIGYVIRVDINARYIYFHVLE